MDPAADLGLLKRAARYEPRPPNAHGGRPHRGGARLPRLQHGAGDLLPLLLQGRGRRVLAGALVPAGGIRLVAFDPVQIGVRPGPRRVMRILAAAMRLVPVALGLPPQGLRRAADPGRRRRAIERRFELLELHLSPSFEVDERTLERNLLRWEQPPQPSWPGLTPQGACPSVRTAQRIPNETRP